MAKKMKKIGSENPAGGGLKKAKQLLEDRLEYETMKDMVNSIGDSNQTEESNSQPSGTPANPEVLGQYTEWLSSLPEDQKQIGMQLVSMMHSMGNSSQMQTNPMMMMMMPQMMQMMQNSGNNNNNNDEAIKGLYNVITEMVKNQNQNNNGDSTADLLRVINESKSNQDDILNMLLQGLINSNSKDDVDEKLNFLTKAKEAGLITDPHTLFEVKKMESENEREKYKIDKDYEVRKMEIDKDKEQTEKASEFLSDIANTVQDLDEGSENKEKDELPQQQAELNYPCPNCETSVTISPQTEDGSTVSCPGCNKNIRVRRKQKQEA